MLIYKITNIITDDTYVGQTTKTLARRFSVHKCNARCGTDTHLYRAMRRYGEQNFKAEVLENQVPATLLDVAEQNWIALLKPHYNETEGGKCNRVMTEKHARSMKEYHANKPRESYATYGNLGKRKSNLAKLKCKMIHQRPCCVKGDWYFSVQQACDVIGIGRTTFRRWNKKGLVLFA
jgi:group I intron endonuclease